jgi:AcrR family transcriptional regulator
VGKAYTEQEKEKIKNSLVQEGIRLFRERGLKSVSIRTLTQTVGISQGGFYTFFEDKEDFITYLIELRVSQKLELRKEHLEDSLKDPVKYISDLIYDEGMHLKENKGFNNMISDSLKYYLFEIMPRQRNNGSQYRNFFNTMVEYWKEHNIMVSIDIDGLYAVMNAAMLLFMNADLVDQNYFATIYRNFVDANVKDYIRVQRDA